MKNIFLKNVLPLFAILAFISCSDDEKETEEPVIPIVEDTFIRASDMSFLPEIESTGTTFKNNGVTEDALTTLKNAGCNTIRIRLWKDPANAHSGFAEVKAFAARVKAAGMKVWLTVHYSDTWADPGHQAKPASWQNLSFADLKLAVAAYTSTIVTEIKPDIIQIGNETNSGFLYPEGNLVSSEQQYLQLVKAATDVVRNESPDTKIMMHFAGISGSDWFFNKISTADYDYIGLSYYPIWHGKSLAALQSAINSLGQTHNKKVVIAETAYPFTLGYDDFTNNIVGQDDQLIPLYPATPAGQNFFLGSIKDMLKQTENGIGFSYWGGEWIAFRGNEATNGSTFENQALWDFDNNALPVMNAFSAN